MEEIWCMKSKSTNLSNIPVSSDPSDSVDSREVIHQ